MNQYLDKEGGAAAEIKRAVLRSLIMLCAFAFVFAACDTGAGSDSSSGDTSTASRAVDSVALSVQSKTLTVADGAFTIDAALSPANASNKKVAWTSSDTMVASVEGSNLSAVVTPKGTGTATITATTADGNRTATCVVNVKAVKSFTVVGDYEKYYEPDDDFDYKNIFMDVIYTDGTVSDAPIPVQRAWIDPLPSTWNILSTPPAPGFAASEAHAIPVRYDGVKETFKVTLRAPRWVTIIGTPKRTVYNVGERFDPEGVTLTASYDFGPNKEGIPITDEIFKTGVNNGAWNIVENYSSWIGPFVYKGVTTSATGVNLTTLNGTASITNLVVSHYVVKVGDKYTSPPVPSSSPGTTADARFLQAFALAEGKTATISVSNNNLTRLAVTDSIDISPSTHITLVGYGALIPLKQPNGAAAYNSPHMFKVHKGGSLRVDNFSLESSDSTSSGQFSGPMVIVNGDASGISNFTLGGKSRMKTVIKGEATAFMDGGIMAILSGKATIEEGAEITIFDDGGSASYGGSAKTSYMGTAGIFVGPEGTLVMEGGSIRGTLAVPNLADGGYAGGTIVVGVGDVVVTGALELGGKAEIGILALAANGPVSKPFVTIKDNWTPNRQVSLNLTGGANSIERVQGYFEENQLFTGETGVVAKKIGNIRMVPPTLNTPSTNFDAGGFFYQKSTGNFYAVGINPILIDTSSTVHYRLDVTGSEGTLLKR